MALNLNNPGNIVKTVGTYWQGAIYPGDSARFVTFENQSYGYRALFKVIQTKILRGLTTITDIINSYAPPSDNNPTESYINYVSSVTGIDRNKPLNSQDFDEIFKIGHAVSRFETGLIPDSKSILEGFNLFRGNQPGTIPEMNMVLILAGLIISGIWLTTKR